MVTPRRKPLARNPFGAVDGAAVVHSAAGCPWLNGAVCIQTKKERENHNKRPQKLYCDGRNLSFCLYK